MHLTQNNSISQISKLSGAHSATLFKSLRFEKSQIDLENSQYSQHPRHLKHSDTVIYKLKDKIKKYEQQLEEWKVKADGLEYQLNFFKSKVQQQFYQNVCLASEMENLNNKVKKIISQLSGLIQNNSESMQSFVNFLSRLQNDSRKTLDSNLQNSPKLIDSLEIQINQIISNINLAKKQNDLHQMIPLQMKKYESQKSSELEILQLKKQIEKLKVVKDNEEIYKRQIQNLHQQREYTRSLLTASQKQKNHLMNEIYEMGKKYYDIDFQNLSRAEVIKLCMNCFAKIKDLEKDNQAFRRKSELFSSNESEKYEKMLDKVKKIRNGSTQKGNKLMRVKTLQYD